jgi:hypothetical protein
MIGVKNGQIVDTPLKQVIEKGKQLDEALFERALLLHK